MSWGWAIASRAGLSVNPESCTHTAGLDTQYIATGHICLEVTHSANYFRFLTISIIGLWDTDNFELKASQAPNFIAYQLRFYSNFENKTQNFLIIVFPVRFTIDFDQIFELSLPHTHYSAQAAAVLSFVTSG